MSAPRQGLERSTKTSKKTALSKQGAAKSGAVGAPIDPIDPALALVVEAWPTLTESVKAGILAMVKMTGDDAEG